MGSLSSSSLSPSPSSTLFSCLFFTFLPVPSPFPKLNFVPPSSLFPLFFTFFFPSSGLDFKKPLFINLSILYPARIKYSGSVDKINTVVNPDQIIYILNLFIHHCQSSHLFIFLPFSTSLRSLGQKVWVTTKQQSLLTIYGIQNFQPTQ